jgi:HlyD family secretion protein
MNRYALFITVAVVALCGFGTFAMRTRIQSGATATQPANLAVVTRGDLRVQVVETGTIDAVKAVEVKSRASGRLARLLVDEGDHVRQGQLIAIIDPKETQLRVEQDRAQLRGAQSGVARTAVEIEQRRVTAQANVRQAQTRVNQLREESGIQPRLTQASLSAAQAALNSARQERERLVNSAHPNARTATASALREARANFENAQRDYERQRELVQRGYISARAEENARLAQDLAKSRLDAATENSALLETQLKLELARADEDIRRAQAELDRADANQIADGTKRREYESALADLEKARIALRDVEAMQRSREQGQATVQQLSSVLGESLRQLGETEIRAPIDGIVTKRMVQEGELVASLSSFSAGTTIVRIEDRRSMRVMLEVNEIDVAKLSEGMESAVEVDALPGADFRGVIHKIAPASRGLQAAAAGQTVSSDAVVKYDVEIWLTGSDPRLRSGMSAKCIIVPQEAKQALYLPVEFVGHDEKGHFVELPPAAGQRETTRKEVQIGMSTGANMQIVTGLAEGDQVQRPKFSGPPRKGMMQFGPDQ